MENPRDMEFKGKALRLYVPLAKRSVDFEHQLAALMGGFTKTENTGAWRMEDGFLCSEVVITYYVIANHQEQVTLLTLVQTEIDRLIDGGEEAVLLEVLDTEAFIFRKPLTH